MLNPLRSFEGIEKVVEDLLEEEFNRGWPHGNQG